MTDEKSGGAAGAETSGSGAAAAPERERRMTAGRKRDAVLRLLRGEPLEIVARELAVTAAAMGLSLRHDHGSQYMSHDVQKELAWLGAASSPAFVRAPEGNGCAERFIRTLKENLLWVRTFPTPSRSSAWPSSSSSGPTTNTG